MGRRSKVGVVAIITVLGSVLMSGAPDAHATNPACTLYGENQQWGGQWNPSEAVTGVRAPIQTLLDGGLCNSNGGTGYPDAASSNWIGIQNNSGDLAQAGTTHIWDVTHGQWCLFYENYPLAGGHLEDCGDESNGEYDWFKVHLDGGYYNIDYCGEIVDYTDCIVWSSAMPDEGTSAKALATAESNVPCQLVATGSSSNPVNIGYGSNTDNDIQLQTTALGSWGVKFITSYFGSNPPQIPCANYQSSLLQSNHVVVTWDSGN